MISWFSTLSTTSGRVILRFASLSLASGVRIWRITMAFWASCCFACSWASTSCCARTCSSCRFLCLSASSSSSSAMDSHSKILGQLRVLRRHILEYLCRQTVYQLPRLGGHYPSAVLLLLNQLALFQLLDC